MSGLVVKIELSNIKKAITRLAQRPDFFLKDLSKDKSLNKDHKLLSYVVSYLYHDDQYKLIIEAITRHDKPSILIPGTLGAYLFGCLLPDYGDTDRECSPLCIGSVPYPPSAGCKDGCDKQVWVLRRYRNKTIYTKVNESSNKTGVIYVDDKFDGFSSFDVYDFDRHGMKLATVMNTTEAGHTTILEECPLSELSMQNGEMSIEEEETSDDNNNAVVILSVVLVIIILIFVIWAMLYH